MPAPPPAAPAAVAVHNPLLGAAAAAGAAGMPVGGLYFPGMLGPGAAHAAADMGGLAHHFAAATDEHFYRTITNEQGTEVIEID